MTMQVQTAPPPESAKQFGPLMQMITGYWVSQIIYAAVKLGVPDVFGDAPLSAAQAAPKLNANEDFLYRLMRALGSLGLLTEDEHKNFRLTALGQALRSDAPNTMRPIALMMGEEHYQAWGKLADGVATGQIPFVAEYGVQCFEYFEKNQRSSEIFNQAMTALVQNDISALAGAYDFGPFERLVDVGGGHGRLVAAILKRNPSLSGVVFDLPHVVTGATEHFKAEGVDSRATAEGGDFFKLVPEGGDAYIMSHIIHDWSDELAGKILTNIHKAMRPNGKLLLAEAVIVPGGEHGWMGPLMDLNMLVMTPGGRERTGEEYRQLLEASGFQLTRIIPVTPSISIIEAVKQSA